MTDTLEEAKAALAKSKDDMTLYYNQKHTPAPEFKVGDMVFLDASDIQTTQPSRKLSHRRLGPFPIDSQVGNGAYRLCLPPSMGRLHPVFNVVKLSLVPLDPFRAVRHLHLPYQKLWMAKKSGWWRKSWTVEWSIRSFVTWSSGRVSVLNTAPGNLGIMFMRQNLWRIFTGGTLVLLVTSVWSTSAPFLSIQCRDVTALKGGWMLGDAPLRPMFPPIFLCHLCIFLLIIASPRQSALAALIPESDDHVM